MRTQRTERTNCKRTETCVCEVQKGINSKRHAKCSTLQQALSSLASRTFHCQQYRCDELIIWQFNGTGYHRLLCLRPVSGLGDVTSTRTAKVTICKSPLTVTACLYIQVVGFIPKPSCNDRLVLGVACVRMKPRATANR